ncbi:DUF1826 domain-containing protein [Novosphingobium sp. BW1]|uniref:DUF1826 domain-containing protein n=1 Tax=Novosphingobium sp. BW1 TaxID=2592621 RepID=UPI0011DED396|nr:DUF1826 domain-containing protein [Novosphingobium sp. BW1]TYC86702.1 DUF1826 domain-containing protein [Novosphingobium sp. BW1]
MSAAVCASAPEVLTRIAEPDVHLAIWQAGRSGRLDWLEALDHAGISDLSFPCALTDLEREIGEGLAEAGYPKGAKTEALSQLMADLCRRFAAIMGCAEVKVRLEVIRTDACRKFHADYVPARLITTLAGPGTQWIEVDAITQGEPEEIHQMRAGDVGLFKGRLLAPEPAILHRSVPLSALGGTRLLLVLDPLGVGEGIR